MNLKIGLKKFDLLDRAGLEAYLEEARTLDFSLAPYGLGEELDFLEEEKREVVKKILGLGGRL